MYYDLLGARVDVLQGLEKRLTMFLKVSRGLGLGIGLLVTLVLTALLVLSLVRGRTPSIAGENSISTSETVVLGGVEHFVVTRGADRNKPVLLMLHGGPGLPLTPLRSLMSPEIEENFTVVMYDQRNAGRSGKGDLEDMTVEQHVADAVELTDLLRERFDQEKIYLLGHSWGAHLGLHVAQAAPEKYHALINTGQWLMTDVANVSNACEDFIRSSTVGTNLEEEYATLLREGGKSLREEWRWWGLCPNDLVAPLGGEIYGETRSANEVFRPYILRTPEYRPLDIVKFVRFNNEHRWALLDQAFELGTTVTELKLPAYFFLGRHDYVTPSVVVPAYLEYLDAPREEVVWFEASAHFPFMEEPEKFARELVRVKREVQGAEASLR